MNKFSSNFYRIVMNKKLIFTDLILLLSLMFTQSCNRAVAQSGHPTLTLTFVSKNLTTTIFQNDSNPCEAGLRDLVELRFLQIEEFIKHLNRFGSCGYRLNQVVRIILDSDSGLERMKFSAILKKEAENNRFEYAWFIAFRPGEAQNLANKYAENGYYFRESMSFIFGSCGRAAEKRKEENKGLGNILNRQPGQMGSFFLFERKAGSFKKNEYRVLDARITGKSGELEANKKKMDVYIAKGFRPVDLWYTGDFNEHFVIMEKDDSVKPQGDYIFVSQYYGMHKKLTELAKQGYKLLFSGLAFALLNRIDDKPLNIEYDSFDTYKDIKKKLRKWKGKDITYLATGISGFFLDCEAFDGKLFFSLSMPTVADRNKDVLFLIKNDFIDDYIKQKGLNPTKKNPLTETQIQEMNKEFINKLNDLVKNGYKLVNFSIPLAEVYVFEQAKE